MAGEGRGRHGNHVRGAAHPRWNGGIATSSHGYLKVQVGVDHPLADPNGYAYLHHLVICSALGRLLGPDETVDHDDENKLNNRLGNLIVRTRTSHAQRHNETRERDELGRFAS